MWRALAENPAARIAAVFGEGVRAPPLTWRTIRVHCGGPQSPLRPIQEAILQIDACTGQRASWTTGRIRRGLRGGLLGEPAESGVGALVAALNRLAQGSHPCAVIIERLELADCATLGVIQRIVEHPGWLRPVLVLGLGRDPVPGARGSDELHAILKNAERFGIAAAARPPLEVAPMPAAARRVIRAAAVIGAGFELDLLCQLLEQEPILVLAGLQDAHDAGVFLEDLSDGRFQMDPRAAAQLSAELLPSLAQAWHHRLAALIHPLEARVAIVPSLGETIDIEPEESAARVPDVVDVEPVAVEPSPESRPPKDTGRARAAAHLGAAGEVVSSIEEYLAAAGEVEPVAVRSAVEWGEEARSLLKATRPERTDLLRRIHTELGRLKLNDSALSGGFSLEQARSDLEAAKALIDAKTPPDQHADILELMASVQHDRGDPASLKNCLEALTEAIALRSESGDAIGAARLLNDQAAVWIRFGDPLRATTLLKESRRRFGRLRHPDAAFERAETDHLLAQLPLHLPPIPGAEAVAIGRALEHAADARRGYVQLGQRREVARLDETIGRLEMARGDLQTARASLASAIDTQQRSGDLTGLARSTSAMASVLQLSGRDDEALASLQTSIQLNAARGSIIGLQLNRTALSGLVMTDGYQDLISIIESAEAMLGSPGRAGVQ